jgi:ribose transport system ATP-binding protein
VGQNGSGKSTLIKTLAGYHTPDPGSRAELDGGPFDLGQTVPDGLRFVHQDLGLVLELNAMDNLALHGGFAHGAMGRVRWREQEEETHRILARFGIDLDIHRPLAAATPVERTVVAIAAALQGWHGGHGVLVLDEPTAVLPHDEVERLFAMVREVRSAGTSVLYVSHRLDEIFELADRVTVLRGGRVIATHAVTDIDASGLASEMVGEEVDPDYRAPVAARPDATVVLEARDVHGRWLRGVDLDVHRGEILGIAGLAGAGVLELPYVIAGCAPHAVTGRIRLPERSEEWCDASDAGELDIPLVPADRGREGIVAEFAVSENLSLSILGRLGRRGRLDKQAEAELVERWTERLGVVAAGPGAPIATLSGGNQQKVVVARCLVREPALLVLCEPTAGVDIGTRVAIYDLIAELSRNGLTVLLSSSDAGDVLAMCTRVVVLRGGQVAAELGGDGLTEHALVSAMEGEDR